MNYEELVSIFKEFLEHRTHFDIVNSRFGIFWISCVDGDIIDYSEKFEDCDEAFEFVREEILAEATIMDDMSEEELIAVGEVERDRLVRHRDLYRGILQRVDARINDRV